MIATSTRVYLSVYLHEGEENQFKSFYLIQGLQRESRRNGIENEVIAAKSCSVMHLTTVSQLVRQFVTYRLINDVSRSLLSV